jgi:hypothetical protein
MRCAGATIEIDELIGYASGDPENSSERLVKKSARGIAAEYCIDGKRVRDSIRDSIYLMVSAKCLI